MGKVGYVLAFVGVVAGVYALTLNPFQAMLNGQVVGMMRNGLGYASGQQDEVHRQMIWTASLVSFSLGVILVIADQFMSYLQKRFPLAPSIEEEFER